MLNVIFDFEIETVINCLLRRNDILLDEPGSVQFLKLLVDLSLWNNKAQYLVLTSGQKDSS